MDSMIHGSMTIMVVVHTTGGVPTGAGTTHGDMAIMQGGTTLGLILGTTPGIMVMQAGMAGLGMVGEDIIPGIGVDQLWLMCVPATAIEAIATLHPTRM